MVRMGEWKLIYDMMGYGQLYHLPTDPHELNNRFGQPDVAREQAALMAELTMWTIRTQDSLPTGPQNRKYQTKWARPQDRKSVVSGKSVSVRVDLGGRRIIKKKTTKNTKEYAPSITRYTRQTDK